MQKFEYVVLTVVEYCVYGVNGDESHQLVGKPIGKALDLLGSYGWEAIGIDSSQLLASFNVLLKRPID